ncbi:hypothetical protein Tco_0794037 [Tanacetum coccineum]
MNPIATQQVALDNALVALEKRLKIVKCNARIEFNKPLNEATYQICLIIPDHDFVEPPSDEEMLSFIQELCYSDYQKYGVLIPDEMINQDIKDYKAYKTYLGFATREVSPKKVRKFKKIASPTKKLSPVLEEELTKKPKRAKKPTKKCTYMPTTGVVIRDTPGVSVSKKKAPTKVDKGKGMYLLSDVALLKVAQLKKVLKKSKQDTHMLHASGSSEGADLESEVPDESKGKSSDTSKGTGLKPRVPAVSKTDHSESENESWGDSEDDDDNNDDSDDNDDDSKSNADDDNDASDSERTDSDDDENLTLNLKDNEEEVYVHTLENYEFTDDEEEYEELYKDVNIRLKYLVHEEEGKGDAEMTDAGRDDAT